MKNMEKVNEDFARVTLTNPVVALDIVLLGGNDSLETWVTGLFLEMLKERDNTFNHSMSLSY